MEQMHSTTILAVSHKGRVAFVGDGQVTLGNTVVKHGAKKIRTMNDGQIVAGFAGSAADSFTLFERFQAKLDAHDGKLSRACVELAKDWRQDKYLRKLEAMILVGDRESLFLLSGVGDVIQPDDGVMAIGSGGNFALASARALVREAGEHLGAMEIAVASMKIAAEICPFTNDNFVKEELV